MLAPGQDSTHAVPIGRALLRCIHPAPASRPGRRDHGSHLQSNFGTLTKLAIWPMIIESEVDNEIRSSCARRWRCILESRIDAVNAAAIPQTPATLLQNVALQAQQTLCPAVQEGHGGTPCRFDGTDHPQVLALARSLREGTNKGVKRSPLGWQNRKAA